ncbi:DUF6266 family protein [Algoriphagus sp. A40]|uniref:DUF6266 family protein n=1 Tax=Algoriphagus sp. A40 TaxID=1945863 RepID=UPI0009863899|nr:DUF6266 family protein [Algoriphagus sp. A40]OOG72735.1 hypothetical protein B0E43_14835 [Algoriphagus sp. A40]
MAKLVSFGGLRPKGKSGGFTFYELDGQTIMRSLPSPNHRNKTHPTALQLLNRQRFREINAFLKPIKKVLNFGFQNDSTHSKKGIHCAFGELVQKGYNFRQNPRIDPAYLKISKGPLLGPEDAQANRVENQIEITWADSSGKGTSFIPDYSMVLLFHPDTGEHHWKEKAGSRASLSVAITLSEKDLNKSWCVYLAFYRKTSSNPYLFSDSKYLGKV